ncbi:MAG TPA: class I SAM-dependent rRNA methyltransferase [Thermoanaerobaculia bacterium]|jgi:23S rRNA (cytosine1962-C5)-methyltransferase
MIEQHFAPERRRRLTIKRGKERVVSNRHPWIFAGAIHAEHGPEDAALADLVDPEGNRVASGFYSRHSQVRLRGLTFGGEELTPELIRKRVRDAVRRRGHVFRDGTTNCGRLVHAEGDDLSSIVVDRYDDVLVVEIANRGVELLRPLIVETLREELSPRGIYFKNDLPVRALEHLSTEGEWEGEGEPIANVLEHGLKFRVDPGEGQKTGFFLDQRENRQLARDLSANKRVLNLFSYTGAFGVYAAAGGAASVENVDVSAPALEMARTNHELNGSEATYTIADAFQYVRRRDGSEFDLLICDPPAFAKSRHDVERAARGYKDVNLFAMRMISPGGLMMTFSCSGHVDLDLFQKIIFAAALDAGRRVSFVRRLSAGSDHPVSIYCPEGEYLKGFLLEVR